MNSSSDSSSFYISTPQSGPSGPSANAALPSDPTPLNLLSPFRTLRIFCLCTLTAASCFWLFFYTSCFLFPLTPSGFFNEMLGISEPGALNFYTLFRLIPLTPLVSRNLILIYISLSGFQDSLLCDLITPTPSPSIFSTDTTQVSGGIIIFVRQGLSFYELSTSFFALLLF